MTWEGDYGRGSLKTVDLGLERAGENDEGYVNLVDLREQVVKAPEPRRFLSMLPVELGTEIFALVIDGDNRNMLSLILVCRAWRDIIFGTSRFWRHLKLTRKTRLKQADTWLQRSGGLLTTLHITGGFSFRSRANVLRGANPEIWSRLDTLIFTSKKNYDISSLPTGATDQLKLVKLEIKIIRLSGGTWQALDKMDKSRLRDLVLHAKSGENMTTDLFFPSLTTLELSLPFSANNTFSFLKGTPMLESLVLKSPSFRYFTNAQIDPVELTYLKYLVLDRFFYTIEYLQHIHCPNLRALTIIQIYKLGVTPQCPTKLEHISLSKCFLPAAHLISVLQIALSLKSLQISQCNFYDPDENAVIEALVKPMPSEDQQGASRMVCCPQLQSVNLSGLRYLKAEPVVRLVQVHFPHAASSDNELGSAPSSKEPPVEPLRIHTLVLDDCPPFDRDVLFWLEVSVPHFSYKAGFDQES